MNSKASRLFVHEWLSLVFFTGLLLALTAAAVINRGHSPVVETGEPHFIRDPLVEISVVGEVENPGSKKVPRGCTVEEVLKIARLLPEADVSKLKKLSKVRPGQIIEIPSATHLTIFIEGNSIKVPRGTRINELPALLKLNKEASHNLRSKRKLKDGESLKI